MSMDIGAADEFSERQVRIVEVAQRQIGIVRWQGDFYAISNVCSHQGGPLCRGVLSARLDAVEPGNLALDPSTPVLACPWHGWEFDLRTGRAILDPALRVRTFTVRVAAGRVLLELDRPLPCDALLDEPMPTRTC
jgi:nitrite reductase/ring-hydroxylating ferredoxin subunit